MFPDQDINRHNYQLRFMEMENKIKRCELERAELEQRFTQLMRERQECEKIAARQLKQKYKRMMELERQRAERNESLLRMLHNIDQQAVSLATKTGRLKMLKTQYESYLIRAWSSQRALPSPSPVPSLNTQQPPFFTAQHQTPSYQISSRLTDSPKSEFVRYLSDMTHAQTVTFNPFPPPMALSNYIHNQQLPTQQHYISPYSAPTSSFPQDTFMRTSGDNSALQNFITNPSPLPKTPITPSRSSSIVPPAKKFELSNEEFIQYIDNEILKGSSNSESDVATSDRPPNIVIEPPSITSTPLPDAYLEDITNDEDEYLRPPAVVHSLDDLPLIEEIAESTANLNLNDEDAMLTSLQKMEKPLVVTDDAVINQRWEKIVEVNSIVRPPAVVELATDPSQETVEAHSKKTPLGEVVAQTLRGVISEVEDQYEVPSVCDISAVDQEPQHSSDQANELVDSSSAFGEMQNEYPQPNYESEADYQHESYFVNTSQGHQEVPPPEYSSQDPEEYNEYSASDTTQQIQQASAEDPTRWTMTKNTVRSKSYSTSQSRTPETIDEVVSNGEENPSEQHSTKLESKHSSPVGQIASTTEIHYSEPETQPEQILPEEVDQQYDYTQYPQEYDPNDPNQQAAYYQQYTDDQTGQNQIQDYEAYAQHDPNQFQQATEYPGPTQYVFEQDYYAEQQPQQMAKADQNQEYYEGDPNATDQQQYYAEGQVDQAYYDQSQGEVEYANYDEQVTTVASDAAPQEEILESVAEEEEEKQMTLDHQTEMADAVQKIEEKTSSGSELVAAEGNSDSPDKPNAPGKEDTTISSANDESDFDFSTL